MHLIMSTKERSSNTIKTTSTHIEDEKINLSVNAIGATKNMWEEFRADKFLKKIDTVNMVMKFSIENDIYFMVGKHDDGLLLTNDGIIQSPKADFFLHLKEKLRKQTFDMCELIEDNNQYFLYCTGNKVKYPIILSVAHIANDENEKDYTSITYTMNVQEMSLNTLVNIFHN